MRQAHGNTASLRTYGVG